MYALPVQAEIKAAKNDAKLLRRMLLDDPEIAQRRDFLWGFTLLHWAAKMDNQKAIRYLLEAGADPSAQAHGGMAPLHLAAMSGHTDAMRLLLEGGADVDVKSNRFVAQPAFAWVAAWPARGVNTVLSTLCARHVTSRHVMSHDVQRTEGAGRGARGADVPAQQPPRLLGLPRRPHDHPVRPQVLMRTALLTAWSASMFY
jgi:hypothetical protein